MQALDACGVKRRKRDRDVELIVKSNRNPREDTAVSEPEFDTTKARHHGYQSDYAFKIGLVAELHSRREVK
jgi:hypothetical protein